MSCECILIHLLTMPVQKENFKIPLTRQLRFGEQISWNSSKSWLNLVQTDVRWFFLFFSADWPYYKSLSSAVQEPQLYGTCDHQYIQQRRLLWNRNSACVIFHGSLTPPVLVHRFQPYLWPYPDMGNCSPNPSDSRSAQFWKSNKRDVMTSYSQMVPQEPHMTFNIFLSFLNLWDYRSP